MKAPRFGEVTLGEAPPLGTIGRGLLCPGSTGEEGGGGGGGGGAGIGSRDAEEGDGGASFASA